MHKKQPSPAAIVATLTAIMIGGLVLVGAAQFAAAQNAEPSRITVAVSYAAIPVGASVTITGVVSDLEGVPVALIPVTASTIDSAGNITFIGTATSGNDGAFSFNWTPPVEGSYNITATFPGTQAYSGSNATTPLDVGSAATSSASLSPSPSATNYAEKPSNQEGIRFEAYGVVVAMLVVIAVAVALLLRLGRRKRGGAEPQVIKQNEGS